MPGRDTGEARIGGSNGSGVPTRLHRLLAYPLAQVNVGVVEVLEKFGKERVTIRGHCLLNSVKHGALDALGIVAGLQQKWRNAANDHRFAHIFRSVLPDVTSHLAATHREPDQGKMLEFQVMHNMMQVLRKSVVVVSRRGLTGLPKSAPVVGDHAIARVEKRGDLFFPRRAAEGISVNQHDRLSGTVIFVIEMDGSGVLFSDLNV